MEKVHITSASSHLFRVEDTNGEKHIIVSGGQEVSLFFLVHNADIKVVVDVVDEKTTVYCAAVVVSAHGTKSSVDFAVSLKASHTKADIYALTLLGDNAKAVVNGGVIIEEGLVQAAGYLSEENILLGEKIQIKALPMLDVRSNDVQASHGAKIDRLDPQKLFYLTAKGLPKTEAEHLMIQSYMQKALDHAKVEDEAIITHIFSLLQGAL